MYGSGVYGDFTYGSKSIWPFYIFGTVSFVGTGTFTANGTRTRYGTVVFIGQGSFVANAVLPDEVPIGITTPIPGAYGVITTADKASGTITTEDRALGVIRKGR